jgi:two-component system, NarL family, nitrate/nitrite response regulator NarL
MAKPPPPNQTTSLTSKATRHEESFRRIVIADDHPMFRDVLSQALARTFPKAQISTVSTFAEAMIAGHGALAVDLFVLDLMFPGMNGEESVGQMRKDFPQSSIVIITMLEDLRIASKMIEAGADGYLGKGLSAEDILNSLARIGTGEFVVNVSPASRGLEANRAEDLKLTRRQIDILSLIRQGKPNKLIARELGLSHFTVRNHVTTLLRVLGINRRSQIVSRAVQLGLIAQSEADS